MKCMYPAVLASLMFSTVALPETILVPLGEDIQSAINSASTGDVVQLEAGTYVIDAQLDTAGKAIIFRGAQASGTSLTTIDSSAADRAMQCVGGEAADTVIEQITFQSSNSSPSPGSLIRILASSPTLRSCTFVSGSGQLVEVVDSAPFFDSCSFVIETFYGMNLFRCSSLFNDCRFTSNSGVSDAVYLSAGSNTFSNCAFENVGLYGEVSNADSLGCQSFDTVFSGCDFSGESTSLSFSAYGCDDSSLLLNSCTFGGSDSNSTSYGYVVRGVLETVEVVDCVFTSNQSPLIYAGENSQGYISSLSIRGCSFTSNTRGGLTLYGAAVISGSTFTSNALSYGSLIDCYGYAAGSQVLIEECIFAGNAGTYGGAISSSDALLTILECDFTDNSASKSGGAIYSTGKAFRLQDTRICGNTPDQISGGYLDLGGNCIETICVNCPDVPECPDSDDDGVCDEDDVCPGEPDQDTDADGVVDCLDECPEDPTKVTFGRCGCGVVDTTILGDFDCDGDFDQDDYLAMGKVLGEDGCSGESGCSGDLNNDGVVDGADLTIILSSWGVCDE